MEHNQQPTFDEAQALFATCQLTLSARQYAQFCTYSECLVEASKRQNLTKILDAWEIWARHFLDSAYLLHAFGTNLPDSLLDVGTGAGFPGLPLAILCPNCRVSLLESEEQKLAFCLATAQKLGVSVTGLQGRAEELAHDARFREQFSAVVSRAVANGSMLCELCMPFLRVDGRFFAMKGANFDETVERFTVATPILGGRVESNVAYTLAGVQKTLVTVLKTEETASQYPRRFAKMKRSSL